MLEMILFAMGLADIDENGGFCPSEASDSGRASSYGMSVSNGTAEAVQHASASAEGEANKAAGVAAATAASAVGPAPVGQVSAPASPCVARKAPQTLSLDSRIPQPLPSPSALRRSGSLRLRGEKVGLGLGHPRTASARGGLGTHARGLQGQGTVFPSITEASESWKKSLRGGGDGLPAHGHSLSTSPGLSPISPVTPISSGLRQQRHHRSLQSLSSRPSSRDTFPHTPTPSPEDLDYSRLNRFLLDHAKEFSGDHDDLDSLRSYGSNCSTQSACDHAQFARNGTTFSGRRMKFIVHCSSHPEPNEYLTPTQRANQQIRRLKALVEQAQKDIEAKDDSIFKLTKEVVELRLLRDETDGSPSKTTGTSEDLPICRVATQLENENGNSTSLSDSGHFDDVLSLTSAQSVHSPGPRHLVPSPESGRLAEAYQRKIDDLTRRLSEKSLEDRKSLVEMYEKKMEDMTRKAREKFLQEKNDLIESYEKKIENIVKKHVENVEEERVFVQKAYEKKIEDSQQQENEISLQHTKTVQQLTLKLEEVQSLLEAAQRNISSLNLQLDDANSRYNDLQQELFQSRERTVQAEYEVETLQKSKAVLEQQISEKQVALVHQAQLESELNILRRHVEEQNETSELKSQLESELARLLNRLKEEEQKCKELECKKTEAENAQKEQMEQASKLVSQLESDLSEIRLQFNEEEQKCKELENENTLHMEEIRKCNESKSQLESELVQLSSSLKEEEEENAVLIKKMADMQTLCEEGERRVLQLQYDFQNELVRVKDALKAEELKSMPVACEKCEILASKEEQLRRSVELTAQLESNLSGVQRCLSDEKEKNKELEHWKQDAKALKEEIVRHTQHEKNLTEQLEVLENEVDELKNSLLEKRESSQNMVNSTIQSLEEKLNLSLKEASDQSQELSQLKGTVSHAESEALLLSNLLSEERNKNKELLHWKSKAEILGLEVSSLEEEIVGKNNQLQYLSGIESEAVRLKQSLSLQNCKIEELIQWKTKAEDLEEEVKSLKEAASEQHTGLPSTQQASVPLEAQQQILSLNAEVAKLKECLDQSYWVQSEKETMRLEMEKAVTEQSLKTKSLEDEISVLYDAFSELKDENEELKNLQQQDVDRSSSKTTSFESDPEKAKHSTHNVCSVDQEQNIIELEMNGKESRNTEDVVSQLRLEIESLKKALTDQEDRHTEMNLKMYLKGQEAAKFERKDQVLELAAQAPEKVSVPELLSQLAETEKELEKVKDNQLENIPKSSLSLLSASEAVCLYLLGSFKAMYRQLAEGQANSSSSPEATLLFLKSAFYYFLTDEANCQGHLHAIQSILGFTESEKRSIDTLTYIRR